MRAVLVLPVPRAAKEIGMGDAAGLNRFLQRLRNMLLPHDFIERGGAISAGQDGISHKQNRKTAV